MDTPTAIKTRTVKVPRIQYRDFEVEVETRACRRRRLAQAHGEQEAPRGATQLHSAWKKFNSIVTPSGSLTNSWLSLKSGTSRRW